MLSIQSCRENSPTPGAFVCNHSSLHRIVKTLCFHHVADQSPPRGRVELTSGTAFRGKRTFEGSIGLFLHVVTQMFILPHRALRIGQCPHSEFPEVSVTQQGAAFLIHNQLTHVSLPGADRFSPNPVVFQGLKISLQLQRPRMSIRRKIAIVQQWSFNFSSESAKKDDQVSIVAFPIQEKALPPAQARIWSSRRARGVFSAEGPFPPQLEECQWLIALASTP